MRPASILFNRIYLIAPQSSRPPPEDEKGWPAPQFMLTFSSFGDRLPSLFMLECSLSL